MLFESIAIVTAKSAKLAPLMQETAVMSQRRDRTVCVIVRVNFIYFVCLSLITHLKVLHIFSIIQL